MITLQNEWLKLDVDENGRVTCLENLKAGTGNLIVDPKPLFRMNLHTGTNYEDMAFGEDQDYCVSCENKAIFVRVPEIHARSGKAAILVEMKITLDGDHICFDAKVENGSQSTVSELFYPCVGAIQHLDEGKMNLLWPLQLGERVEDVEAVLRDMTAREALYEIQEKAKLWRQ